VPAVCVLDPDGDIVDHVRKQYGATRSALLACYHTRLWEWECGGTCYGIVGYAVGGAFAVLVAEQLFASGCQLLINVASAGQIRDVGRHLITSWWIARSGRGHQLIIICRRPPFANADPSLIALAARRLRAGLLSRAYRQHVDDGCTVFARLPSPLRLRRDEGILAVEMEAAALYAFANALCVQSFCLAHVSNRLGCLEGDFEKGDRNGVCESIGLVTTLASAWSQVGQRKRARLGSSRCGMTHAVLWINRCDYGFLDGVDGGDRAIAGIKANRGRRPLLTSSRKSEPTCCNAASLTNGCSAHDRTKSQL